MLPKPPKGFALILAIGLARIAFGYQLQTVATLGPVLTQAFSLDFAALGTLMGLYMAPGVLVALPCGFLARRFGDFAIAAIGIGLMTAGALIAAAAPGPAWIGVGRVISGCGAVAVTVLQGKIISDRFQGGHFVTFMGMMTGAFPIGLGLAQLTQPRLAAAFGWPAAFLAAAALSGVTLVLFVLAWRPVERPLARSVSWPSRHEVSQILIASLIWMAYNAVYINFLAYMPSFLVKHGHPASTADAVMTVATWGNLPCILVGGALAIRFGPTRVFLVGTLLAAISVGGAAVWDQPLLWGTIFGTIASMHGGLIVQIGTLSARPENRAVGMGLFYTAYYIGGGFIPALCGRAADFAGDPSGAFVAAAVISLAAIPFYFIHRSRMFSVR